MSSNLHPQLGLLVPHPRPALTDHQFGQSRYDGDAFDRTHFIRCDGKAVTFKNVSFKFAMFDGCYLRNCAFESCDFTGAQFNGTNLRGATFEGCDFRYATFSHSLVEHSLLERHLPNGENLKSELARSLRTNFAQIGDTQGVNKAISAELRATSEHLKKAWQCEEAYYSNKYRGLKRLEMFLRYIGFRSMHYLWGNGESVARVGVAVLVCIAALWVLSIGAGLPWHRVGGVPLFFGVQLSDWSSPTWIVIIGTGARLIFLALFVTVLTRRLSRR